MMHLFEKKGVRSFVQIEDPHIKSLVKAMEDQGFELIDSGPFVEGMKEVSEGVDPEIAAEFLDLDSDELTKYIEKIS